jgi:uncharacterized protein
VPEETVSWTLYEMIEAQARCEEQVRSVMLGLNWSTCALERAAGICFSPLEVSRTLRWPGTLCGRPANTLIPWLRSFEPAEATVGLCIANAAINRAGNALLERAQVLAANAPGHLRVFAHFTEQLRGASVAVIGRYPGLERLWADLPYQCLERRLSPDTLPDSAAEYVLPRADWVFITGSAIANKTAPRLLELCRGAKVVLLGPSVPWLQEWRAFGVDYVAGVSILDSAQVYGVAAEGGGTRLFDSAVEYRLAAL